MKIQTSASLIMDLVRRWIWPVIFTFYVVLVFVPWVPRSWQPPCNNSWALVLHDAFLKHEVFGTDVVFTFGPYGFLYFGAVPQTYALTLSGWILIGVGYAIAVWKTLELSALPPWARLLGALLVTAVTASVDVVDAQVFSFAAFASAAWILVRPKDIPSNVLVGAALALASLVKFSWLIAIAPCVAVMTVFGLMRERRSALVGVAYAVGGTLLWLATGQSMDSVGTYISSSLEVTSGYAGAMQLGHPWGMTNVWAYVSLAVFLVGFPAFALFRRDSLEAIAFSGTMAFLLLIAFKGGFVRHDHHEVVSMALLVSIATLLFYVVRQRMVASVAVAAALVLFGFCVGLHEKNPSFESRLGKTVRFRGVADFFVFMSGKVNPTRHYADDMEPIARNQPFEMLSGTVDLYPWGGIDVMYANKLEVKHRPVFESYTAYTSQLARINRDFLRTASAPDQLLFAIRSLDQRFPAMDDGLSWPEILTRYDILNEQHGYLLMQRRENPREYRMTAIGETRLQPDTLVALPEADALWAELDLPLTSKGRLLKQLYKPKILILVIQLADGNTHTFRLIPDVASAGFLISPVIPNNAAFAVFQNQAGDSRLSQLRPRAIAISGEAGFAGHYDFGKSKLRFFRMEFAAGEESAQPVPDANQ
jgi:hypothetical protein